MKIYAKTDIGQVRQVNQDYIFASKDPIGNLPNLFIVADGMGGHKAGGFASDYATNVIVQTIRNDIEQNPISILKKAIEEANIKLLEKAEENPELSGMGTTVVAATIFGYKMTVANVGDSRLYLIGNGIEQITRDHSLVEEMVKVGEIDRNSARNHPDKNIITRAVGVEQSVQADIFEKALKGDEIILMCSDGLTNMIEDEDIKAVMKSYDEVKLKAVKLIDTANDNGGKDNIAVIVIEPFASEVKIC